MVDSTRLLGLRTRYNTRLPDPVPVPQRFHSDSDSDCRNIFFPISVIGIPEPKMRSWSYFVRKERFLRGKRNFIKRIGGGGGGGETRQRSSFIMSIKFPNVGTRRKTVTRICFASGQTPQHSTLHRYIHTGIHSAHNGSPRPSVPSKVIATGLFAFGNEDAAVRFGQQSVSARSGTTRF